MGCDFSIENDCENLTIAENENKKTDDTSLIFEEENTLELPIMTGKILIVLINWLKKIQVIVN